MAVQSIWAAIEEGDIAGNHLFVTAREVAFRKMNGVGKFNYLAQKIRPRTETLDDAGHLLSPRTGSPEIVCGSNFSGSFSVFGNLNFCRRLCWGSSRFGFVIHGQGYGQTSSAICVRRSTTVVFLRKAL